MSNASNVAHDLTDPRSDSDRTAAGEAWGPSIYRGLAVLTLLLAGVSALIGADLVAIATQLWYFAQIALAAAVLAFLLSR